MGRVRRDVLGVDDPGAGCVGVAMPEDAAPLGPSLEAGRVRTPTQGEEGAWGRGWRGGLGMQWNSRKRGLELGLGWEGPRVG